MIAPLKTPEQFTKRRSPLRAARLAVAEAFLKPKSQARVQFLWTTMWQTWLILGLLAVLSLGFVLAQ
jgi:hypothetical protein